MSFAALRLSGLSLRIGPPINESARSEMSGQNANYMNYNLFKHGGRRGDAWYLTCMALELSICRNSACFQ
jgi:hypothetical protein